MGCENHRYIVCITNEFCDLENSRVKKDDIKELVRMFKTSLIVLGVGMDL